MYSSKKEDKEIAFTFQKMYVNAASREDSLYSFLLKIVTPLEAEKIMRAYQYYMNKHIYYALVHFYRYLCRLISFERTHTNGRHIIFVILSYLYRN